MTASADILLVSDSEASDLLCGRLAGRCHAVQDPYDALFEMARRRWEMILLAGSGGDLPDLARAARRLQDEARLIALCSPATEPQVRCLRGNTLDDYFIYPPTHQELVNIARQANARPALTPHETTAMMDAAVSVASLEARAAELVRIRLDEPVQWSDASAAPADAQKLLMIADGSPRVLTCEYPVDLDDATRIFLQELSQVMPALLTAAKRTQRLHELATTDHLTGAYNRRYFYHLTDEILSRPRQDGRDVRETLLLFDIDDFKRYNDTYGHAAGDEILREIATLIRRTTRRQDIVARIGGDEFAVLFWDVDEPRQPGSRPPETATVMAERFRQVVARHEFPSLGPEARGSLTISGGLATYGEDGESCIELLRSADAALRGAKLHGKNGIRLIGE